MYAECIHKFKKKFFIQTKFFNQSIFICECGLYNEVLHIMMNMNIPFKNYTKEKQKLDSIQLHKTKI